MQIISFQVKGLPLSYCLLPYGILYLVEKITPKVMILFSYIFASNLEN